MIALGQLGSAALYLAAALSVYSIIVGIIGAISRDAKLLTSARYASVAVFLAMTTAIVTMEVALLSSDFSVKYVAAHSRLENPTWVKFVTLWAALEGSVLLWGWILTIYTAILALVAKNNILRPWVLVVMQAVQLFFISMTVIAANPFITLLSPPVNGPGPNPLLQNHWMMAVHPVLLYLGYVGLTVPFAFAMSALITKQPGTEWMTQSRRWTMTGWAFLTAGIVAGGWWSYVVLGWGGYWAWDPVENVSFMPWLAATAFIHSIQVQERRRMLKGWNLALIIMAFALSILGTFLVRSGIISSVHAFGDGPVGPYLLVFFLVLTISSVSLTILRWDQLRDNSSLDSALSRESSYLGLNVLLLAMAFTVLLGTIFPLIVEAITNNKVTVGAPFFNAVSVPLWLLIF
ncbi:MAG TPA: heme lyase CcmF/NrfE family subunit, partial [Trueperaceae bacterium]|nr:heme lyase CcmF/NrfE family subunit [Trueperaceae bacterium]